MAFELFGNIYEEVEDNRSESDCLFCALLKICEKTKPLLPCKRKDGNINRHFIIVEKLNEEK
jgi:hypothetical protein